MKLSEYQVTRYLFVVTIAVLTVFGIGSLLRIGSNPERAGLYIFYALAMFVDAALMVVCFTMLGKRTSWAFYISLTVLAFNILPTIFDQFGLADLLFVLLNFATLIFLLRARWEFLPA
jgi:hypothetical protein